MVVIMWSSADAHGCPFLILVMPLDITPCDEAYATNDADGIPATDAAAGTGVVIWSNGRPD